MSAANDATLGRYSLVRKLATGGMAEVFLAKAEGPGGFEKQLVIKRVLPDLAEDKEFIEMFLGEARLTAGFNHPNIVQIFDFGSVDGTYFLAMEYVDGPNLRQVLRRRADRKVPLGVAARIVALACEGLAYAHEFVDPNTGEPYNLIHRDISPDNLLVGRNGAVKVFDFGVAKVVGRESKSIAGTVKGKIAYMPPEQLLGEADMRADVYALGVVLYELAAGTKPYERLPDVQLMAAILQQEPVPLAQRVPDVPAAFAAIVARAMARDVSQRYQSCRELAAALEDFLMHRRERVGAQQVAQFVISSMDGAATGPSTTPKGQGTGTDSRTPTGQRALATGVRDFVNRGEPSSGRLQATPFGGVARPVATAAPAVPAAPAPDVWASAGALPALPTDALPPLPTDSSSTGLPPKPAPSKPSLIVRIGGDTGEEASDPSSMLPPPPVSVRSGSGAYGAVSRSGVSAAPALGPLSELTDALDAHEEDSTAVLAAQASMASRITVDPPPAMASRITVDPPPAMASRITVDPPPAMAARIAVEPVPPSAPRAAASLSTPMQGTARVAAAAPAVAPPPSRPAVPGTGRHAVPEALRAAPQSSASFGFDFADSGFVSAPSPQPAPAAPPRPVPEAAAAATAEARAAALMADAETMRLFEAGPPLAAEAELAPLRGQVEQDEGLNLLSRFPAHAVRLLQANPAGGALLGDRIIGAIEGLVLTESFGRLARLIARLGAAAEGSPERKVMDMVTSNFVTPQMAVRLVGRLKEGAPADVDGFAAFLTLFGAKGAAQWLTLSEDLEGGAGRDALLRGLVGLARLNPEPFVARVASAKVKRLADYVFVCEEAKAADRGRAFRQLLGRRDATLTREVLTGLARARSEDGHTFLTQALGDRVEANRLLAFELLAQHYPARVFKAVEPFLDPETFSARSQAERAALCKAVGGSDQPEAWAMVTEVFKQKASIINRGRVDPYKVEMLEALGAMKRPEAQELLKAIAADKGQGDTVQFAAQRLAARLAGEAKLGAVAEVRRFERNPMKPRELVLELVSLSRAARVVDPRRPGLELPLSRLRYHLEVALRASKLFSVVVEGPQLLVNDVAVQVEAGQDPEADAAIGVLSRRGVRGFTITGAALPLEELQHLVRWLAEGPGAEGVVTPNVVRHASAGAADRPAPPVIGPPADLRDPSKEAMIRYVDLVLATRTALARGGTLASLDLASTRRLLHELAWAAASRQVRFHGLTPFSAGRDAVVFHAANVALLSLTFAAELGVPVPRLQELAEYAFSSDVGMFELPEAMLGRTGDLTHEDKLALTNARKVSAWYPFERLGDAPASASWASVVAEHGLDWGERGPDGRVTPKVDIGLFGGIVSLAKTYDALTSRRSFRATMTPEAALEVMTTKAGHRFRPELLVLFVRFVKRHTVRVLRS